MQGLPNNWRETLLQQRVQQQRRGVVREVTRGDVALLLDVLLAAGVELAGQEMTISEVQHIAAAFGCAAVLVRRGLMDSLFTLIGKQNTGRGRPQLVFRLPTRADIARQLGSPGEIVDQLQPGDFRTITTYKRALYREHIKRANVKREGAPASFSRKLLARRINVSKKTTRNYDKALGVQVEAQIKEEPISPDEIPRLPSSRPKGKQDRRTWIQVYDYYGAPVKRIPALRQLAAREIMQFPGCQLALCEQMTSTYWLPVDVAAKAHKPRRRWNKAALEWLIGQG